MSPVNEGSARAAWFVGACVAALALLGIAYSNFFHNAFQFDDGHVLVENLYIRSLQNIPRFFTDASTFSQLPTNADYRPICSLSLAIDYAVAGRLDPVVFHASQLLQMALLWLALLFFYWRAMDAASPDPANRYLALFTATLFAVHTINTETLNLMHARSEILSALGVVGAFLIYWRGGLPRRLGLHVVAMLLGALAKPPAIIFGPLLFVWVVLAPERLAGAERPAGSAWVLRLKAAARAAFFPTVVGASAFLVISRLAAPGQSYGGGDRFHYALTQAWAWLHYLRLLVVPLGLSADTDLKLIQDWYDTRVLAGCLVIALLAWAALRTARRARAWLIAFGLSWFALGLAPASSILPLAEPVNEHRPFLGSIGLLLAAVWAARLAYLALVRRNQPHVRWIQVGTVGACLAILALHAAATHERNKVWFDGASLWGDVTRKSPENGRAWMNYGLTYMARGDYPQARSAFERALALTPNYYYLEINLGILEGSAGDQGKAEAHFQSALRLAPSLPGPHFYYGRWLIGVGRAAEAIAHLETAIRITPGFESALELLMDLLAARGDLAGARQLAERYLAVAPDGAKASAYRAGKFSGSTEQGTFHTHFDQGLRFGQSKRWLESALAYRAALELVPDSADALTNLGWTLGNLGLFAEAVPLLERALELQPSSVLARNNLRWVRTERDRPERR